MRSALIKLLILLGATALLPWIAYFVGQISAQVAIWGHVTGVVVVLALKLYDLIREKGSQRISTGSPLDDTPDKEVNESGSDAHSGG